MTWVRSVEKTTVINAVHGSTGLTTNGRDVPIIDQLTVRPELCRRAQIEFSHSLAFGMTDRLNCHSEQGEESFLMPNNELAIQSEPLSEFG
jgi:hypothetical protein